MRDVVIYEYCDRCWHESDETRTIATTQFSIGVNEGDRSHPAVKLLMVCDAHAVEIKQLGALLAEITELPNKSPAKPAKVIPDRAAYSPHKAPSYSPSYYRRADCPVCGTQHAQSALAAHIWNVHSSVKQVIPTTCPDCSKHFDAPQAMATHRRVVHDYSSTADALSHVPGYRAPKKLSAKAAQLALGTAAADASE